MELKKLTAVVDGVEIELTAEQVEEWCRKKREKENPFNRTVDNQYFYIDWNFNSIGMIDRNGFDDDIRYDAGNYCTDQEMMKQRAYWLQLEQLLWRDSYIKNQERQNSCAVYILFDKFSEKWKIQNIDNGCSVSFPCYLHWGDALYAIESIVIPFCKEHPDFRP